MMPSTASSPTPSANVVKVLVVDDMHENLIAMRALLERPGLQVLGAQTGEQALELLLEHEVALALLDVQMPGMDGFMLAELMRGAQRTREVPIIFLTASPNDPTRSFQGYEAGAVDFLHKPVDPRVIESKVAVFIQLYEQRRELRDRNDALERLIALNETMAAVLTHDLRTPLSAMMMAAEIVRIQATTDSVRRSGERIKSSGLRMSRMITQLLDFTRLRSGSVRIDPQSADLEAVCRAAVAEILQAHPEATIEVTAEGDLKGTFDPDRMTQVFSNLLGNAVQHGTAGQPILVALDGRQPGELRASVFNAGSMPEAIQPRLFAPFKELEDRRDGLGLGLYIVDQFVRAHGGGVSGNNTAEGVLFQVRLPRSAPAEGAAAPEGQAPWRG